MGECGGDACLDECDVCNGPGILLPACDCNGTLFDCDGVCGGNKTIDECGVCGG